MAVSTSFRKRSRQPSDSGLLVCMVLTAISSSSRRIIIRRNWSISSCYDPVEWNLSDKLDAPSLTHWLGTDQMGRDLWSRIMVGARVSLLVGFASVAFGSGLGGILGIVSAWFGGKVDQIMQRLMDALMAIPTLILALAVTASLGQSLFNIILAIGIVQIPRANRVVRSQALAVKEAQFVDAARAIGAGNLRIMMMHITP